MRKAMLFGATVLLSGAMAFAQTDMNGSSAQQNPSQDQSSQSSMSSSSSSPQTIQGCLSGSNGNFTLTDQSGKVWQLQGSSNDLADKTGHEVAVTGSQISGGQSASASSGQQEASNAATAGTTGSGAMVNDQNTAAGGATQSSAGTASPASTGTAGTLQVSSVSDIASSCSNQSSTGNPQATPPYQSQPQTTPPDQSQPQGQSQAPPPQR